MTPQEALAHALITSNIYDLYDMGADMSDEDYADAILAALPEGWELTNLMRPEFKHRNEYWEQGHEAGAKQERGRLLVKAQKHHDAQHHGPAVYSTAESFMSCTVRSCCEATILLAEPEA